MIIKKAANDAEGGNENSDNDDNDKNNREITLVT